MVGPEVEKGGRGVDGGNLRKGRGGQIATNVLGIGRFCGF